MGYWDDLLVNERGSISLPVIIAVVLGLGLAASTYLNVVQHQSAQADRKLMQGEITDLRYQVNKDLVATASSPATASPAPTPTPLATPEPSPSATPLVAGTGSVSISQLAIKLTVADPVADLTYDMVKNGEYTVAGLSTRSLISKYPACAPSDSNSGLGQIVRKKAGIKSSGTLIKQAGVYSYYYVAPVGFCASDVAGRNTLAAARAAVKNATLPSLTN